MASWHLESPRTPLECQNYRGTYPSSDLPSGRRLFPKRRTITPVLTILNTFDRPSGSAFEVHSLPIEAPQEKDDQSEIESPSSSGSVKIDLLSTLELPPVACPADSGHRRTPSKSQPKLHRNQAPSPVINRRLPNASAAESTGQLLKENKPKPERSELGNCHYEPIRKGDSIGGRVSLPPKLDPVVSRKIDAACPSRLARCDARASGAEVQLASATTSLPAPTISLTEDTIHHIDSWESSVKLCTNVVSSTDGTIQLNHHARMTVIVPKVYIPAERVRLSIVVSNGICAQHEKVLAPGHSSLFFEEVMSSADISKRKDEELIVVRDTCDLEYPLDLYLCNTYSRQDQRFIVASLPTFRPCNGKTSSEMVAITHPSPPLAMKVLSRGDLSTWKETTPPVSHATYLERANMPRLYPDGFKDSIRIKVWTPNPVSFNSLESLQPCDLVWNLDMTVERVIGGAMECDMTFCVEVDEADRLVSIDPHGWAPKYFVIDGRLTTEQMGEWRENEQGCLTLFKRTGTKTGPLRVETHWQEPKNGALNHGDNNLDLPLPRIVDLKVVGGDLTCRVDKRLLVRGHSGSDTGSHTFIDAPHARLPSMFPGYKLSLTPKSKETSLPLNSVPEEGDPVRSPSQTLSSGSEMGGDADGQNTLIDHMNGLSPSNLSYSRRLLVVFFTLCLILFVLLYNQLSLKGGLHRLGHLAQGHLDLEQAQQFVALQQRGDDALVRAPIGSNEDSASADAAEAPAGARHMPQRDEVVRPQLEAMRDWVDHALGWQQWQGYA